MIVQSLGVESDHQQEILKSIGITAIEHFEMALRHRRYVMPHGIPVLNKDQAIHATRPAVIPSQAKSQWVGPTVDTIEIGLRLGS